MLLGLGVACLLLALWLVPRRNCDPSLYAVNRWLSARTGYPRVQITRDPRTQQVHRAQAWLAAAIFAAFGASLIAVSLA